MLKNLLAAFVFAGASALVIAPAAATPEQPTIGDEPTELNITCNDGTTSPTCTTCHRGCCSHHGGCR